MKQAYNYYHTILLGYFQGTITKNELLNRADFPFKIEKLSEWSDFLADLEASFSRYHEPYFLEWLDYKEYAEDTAPTVKGLLHSLKELLAQRLSQADFLEWATWHNVDGGETTSGKFENKNIEFFCLYFLPKKQQELDFNFYQKLIPLVEKSNELAYGEFVMALYLLLERERKSLYFFLKEYINGNKNEKELDQYLIKKFHQGLSRFSLDISTFPYLKELNQCKEEKKSIDNFMKIMKV